MATIPSPPKVRIQCPDPNSPAGAAKIVLTTADGREVEIQHLVTRVAIDLACNDTNRATLEVSPGMDVEAYLNHVAIVHHYFCPGCLKESAP